jgi:protein phosphatase PTC1
MGYVSFPSHLPRDQANTITPQLWDVCSDQEAVDLVRTQLDPNTAAKQLVDYALARFSTDNLSCMIVRFDKSALLNSNKDSSTAIGVEGDAPAAHQARISEAEKLVAHAKHKAHADGVPTIGVSGSNSGKGHEPLYSGGAGAEADAITRADMEMEKVVEEEPDVHEEEEVEEDEDEDGAADEDGLNGASLMPEREIVDLTLPPGAAKPAT